MAIALQVLRLHSILLHVRIYVFLVVNLLEIFEERITLFGHAKARRNFMRIRVCASGSFAFAIFAPVDYHLYIQILTTNIVKTLNN